MLYVDIEPFCVFCGRPTTEVLQRKTSGRVGQWVMKRTDPYPAHKRCRFLRMLPSRACYAGAICAALAMPILFVEALPRYSSAGLVAWFVAPIALALLGFILGGRIDGPITDYVLSHQHPVDIAGHRPLSNALNKPPRGG